MGEQENDSTLAAQPRTLAATSALPISRLWINKCRPDILRRNEWSDKKTPHIDIGRTHDGGDKKSGYPFCNDSPDRLAPALLANWRTWMRAKRANV